MNWKQGVPLLVVLTVWMAYAAPALASHSLSGKVLDERGKGIPGVQVMMDQQNTWTSQDGKFHLAEVEAGKHMVCLQLPGYIPAQQTVQVGKNKSAVLSMVNRPALVWKARTYQGTARTALGMEQYVHKVYGEMGLSYPQVPVQKIWVLAEFKKVGHPLPGDLVLFGPNPSRAKHMGIVLDPEQKTFIGSQCKGVAVASYNGKQGWGNAKYGQGKSKGYYGLAGFYRYQGCY